MHCVVHKRMPNYIGNHAGPLGAMPYHAASFAPPIYIEENILFEEVRLTHKQQLACDLKAQGKSERQIAKIMGIGRGRVHMHLKIANEKLAGLRPRIFRFIPKTFDEMHIECVNGQYQRQGAVSRNSMERRAIHGGGYH